MRIKRTVFMCFFLGMFSMNSHVSMGGSALDAVLAAIAAIEEKHLKDLHQALQYKNNNGFGSSVYKDPVGTLSNICNGVNQGQKPDLFAACLAIKQFLTTVAPFYAAMVNAAGSGAGTVAAAVINVEVEKFINICTPALAKLLASPEFVPLFQRAGFFVPATGCFVMTSRYYAQ